MAYTESKGSRSADTEMGSFLWKGKTAVFVAVLWHLILLNIAGGESSRKELRELQWEGLCVLCNTGFISCSNTELLATDLPQKAWDKLQLDN